MRLVDDWKKCWKWASMQFAGGGFLVSLGMAIATAMSATSLHGIQPDWVGWTFGAFICGAILIGRMLQRGKRK